jgi:hypothetical protein
MKPQILKMPDDQMHALSMGVFRTVVLAVGHLMVCSNVCLLLAVRTPAKTSFLDDDEIGIIEMVAYANGLVLLIATVLLLAGVHFNRTSIVSKWVKLQTLVLLVYGWLFATTSVWTAGLSLLYQMDTYKELLETRALKHAILFTCTFAVNAAMLALVMIYHSRLRRAKNLDDIHIESVAKSTKPSFKKLRSKFRAEEARKLATIRRAPLSKSSGNSTTVCLPAVPELPDISSTPCTSVQAPVAPPPPPPPPPLQSNAVQNLALASPSPKSEPCPSSYPQVPWAVDRESTAALSMPELKEIGYNSLGVAESRTELVEEATKVSNTALSTFTVPKEFKKDSAETSHVIHEFPPSLLP